MSASGIRAGRAYVEIGADSQRLDAALVRLRAKLSAFGTSLATIGTGMVAASAGVLGALAWPLTLAANMEQTQAAFETMLKSGDAAKALLSDLQKFAASTPFEFPELADAAKKLLAFGSSAGSIKDELRTLGDIASAIGVPIGEVAEIYGKARVQGRLFAEDINQLTGRGIPVIKALADQFGVTEPEVKKLVEAGKIGFPELQKALQAMTTGTGQFAGGMERQSKTMLGMWSTLKDNIGNAARPIGEALLPAMKTIVDVVSTAVAVVGRFVEQNAALVGYVAAGAAALGALGAVLVAVGTGFAGLSLAASGVGTLWAGLVGAAGAVGAVGSAALAALLSPLGLIAAAVIGVTTALGGWSAVLSTVRSLAGQAMEFIAAAFGETFTRFGEAADTLAGAWESVVTAVASGNLQAAADVATAGLSLAWAQTVEAMAQLWRDWTAGFRDQWTDATTYLAQLGASAFFGLATIWENAVTFMRQTFDTLATYMVGMFDLIGTRIAQLASLWSSVWSGDTGPEAFAKTDAIQKQFEERAKAREQGNRIANQAIGQESQRRIDNMRSQAADYFNQLNQLAEEEKAARRRGNNAAIQAAEQRLKEAQEKFNAMRQQIDAPKKPPEEVKKAADNAAAKSDQMKSAGSFNAGLVAQQLGLRSTQDEIKKNTKKTADAVARMADKPGMVYA